MTGYGDRLRLAYYISSDGPRLVMFGPLGVDLLSLQGTFRRLATTGGHSLQLDDQPFVVPFARIRLSSSGELSGEEEDHPFGLRQIRDEGSPSFRWVRTCEGWDYLAELLQGLIDAPTAGHQYMTSYPDEDAIVVVSKGEYTDDVLER